MTDNKIKDHEEPDELVASLIDKINEVGSSLDKIARRLDDVTADMNEKTEDSEEEHEAPKVL